MSRPRPILVLYALSESRESWLRLMLGLHFFRVVTPETVAAVVVAAADARVVVLDKGRDSNALALWIKREHPGANVLFCGGTGYDPDAAADVCVAEGACFAARLLHAAKVLAVRHRGPLSAREKEARTPTLAEVAG